MKEDVKKRLEESLSAMRAGEEGIPIEQGGQEIGLEWE